MEPVVVYKAVQRQANYSSRKERNEGSEEVYYALKENVRWIPLLTLSRTWKLGETERPLDEK